MSAPPLDDATDIVRNGLPKISIALATFNGERFLAEQLLSLARQTHPPAELVVCDDRSSDGTIDVIERFARHAAFPVHIVVNDRRLNYRANFLKAAGLCGAEIIAFCDQDDIWDDGKLEAVAQAMQDPSVMLVEHACRLIDREGRPIDVVIDESRIRDRGPWARALGLTQAFRRRLLDFSPLWEWSIDQHDPKERMAHDQWVYFIGLSLSRKVYLSVPLLGYRQHGGNTYGFDHTRSTSMQAVREIGQSLVAQVLPRRGTSDANGRALRALLEGHVLAARARIRILEAMLLMCGDEDRSALQSALSGYKAHIDYISLRLKLHIAPALIIRIIHFCWLNLALVYARKGRRGIKDSILDLVFGVLQPPRAV